MRTREIPRTEWGRFFDDFSRRNEGRPVRLDVLGGDIGAQHEVADWPLVGITTSAEPEPAVHLLLGRPPAHLSHAIPRVAHVRVERNEHGADVALQIEADDGIAAIVTFPPAPATLGERAGQAVETGRKT